MIHALDLLGTFVFAVSGCVSGMDRRFDLFGASVVALVTAVGGGTLRDILMGAQPVSWMENTAYLWTVLVGILVTVFFTKLIRRLHKTLYLFDALGIGVFTILGLQKALLVGLDPWVAVMMGVLSAVFGGVIRDVLCSEVPLIFRKEIYASACLAGGILYILILPWSGENMFLVSSCICLIILIRLLSLRLHWYLPTYKK